MLRNVCRLKFVKQRLVNFQNLLQFRSWVTVGVEFVVVSEMQKFHDETKTIFTRHSTEYRGLQQVIVCPAPTLLWLVNQCLEHHDANKQPPIVLTDWFPLTRTRQTPLRSSGEHLFCVPVRLDHNHRRPKIDEGTSVCHSCLQVGHAILVKGKRGGAQVDLQSPHDTKLAHQPRQQSHQGSTLNRCPPQNAGLLDESRSSIPLLVRGLTNE